MEEIKVGEYVRTKEGRIFRIAKIDYGYVTDTLYRNDKGYSGRYDSIVMDYFLYLKEEQIKECKHSPNIIDIIERRRLRE